VLSDAVKQQFIMETEKAISDRLRWHHIETGRTIPESLRLKKLACLLPESSTTLAGQS